MIWHIRAPSDKLSSLTKKVRNKETTQQMNSRNTGIG